MRWAVSKCDWRKRFAWLPVKIGDEWVWLERYECRPMGEYREVRAAHAHLLTQESDNGQTGE